MAEQIGASAYILNDSDIEIQDSLDGDLRDAAATLDADGHIDGYVSGNNRNEISENAEYRGSDLGTTIDTTLGLLLGAVFGGYQLRGLQIVCEGGQPVKLAARGIKFDSNSPADPAGASGDHLGYDLDVASYIGAHGGEDVPTSPGISNAEADSDLVKLTLDYRLLVVDDVIGGDGENGRALVRGGEVTATLEYIGVAPTLTATGWTLVAANTPSSNRRGDRFTYVYKRALASVAA